MPLGHSAVLVSCCLALWACTDRQQAEHVAGERDSTYLAPQVTQACAEVAEQFRKIAASNVVVAVDSFPTPSARHFGCVVRAQAVLGGAATVPFLARGLADSLGAAWKRDSTIVEEGSNGATYTMIRGDVRCLFQIGWTIRVRYDVRSESSPYNAAVGCAATPGRESVP